MREIFSPVAIAVPRHERAHQVAHRIQLLGTRRRDDARHDPVPRQRRAIMRPPNYPRLWASSNTMRCPDSPADHVAGNVERGTGGVPRRGHPFGIFGEECWYPDGVVVGEGALDACPIVHGRGRVIVGKRQRSGQLDPGRLQIPVVDHPREDEAASCPSGEERSDEAGKERHGTQDASPSGGVATLRPVQASPDERAA